MRLCGISVEDRPLDVDHIVPRSRWEIDRGQPPGFVFQMQSGKGNRDDRDFRSLEVKRRIYGLENLELPIAAESPVEPFDATKSSVFLDLPEERVLLRTEHFFVIEDGFPVAPGHLLVISSRLCPDWFSLTPEEQGALPAVLDHGESLDRGAPPAGRLQRGDELRRGGRPNRHAFPLPPHSRSHGDTPRPRGGVRGVIPSKQGY